MVPRKQEETPAVGEVFARRLREARSARPGGGWTQQQLADAMKRIGFPINRATIAKIEKAATPTANGGEKPRAVTLEEAIGFAVALDVSPLHLFIPIEGGEERVQLAPKVEVDVRKARMWARGTLPLDPKNIRFYVFQRPPVDDDAGEDAIFDELEAMLTGRRSAKKKGDDA